MSVSRLIQNLGLASLTATFALSGCKSSLFSGASPKAPQKEQKTETKEDKPRSFDVSDPIVINPVVTEAPVDAEREGSFTAWTDPKSPARGQDYNIHIEVSVPSGTTSYLMSDLTGQVVGTDDFTRTMGPNPTFTTIDPFTGQKNVEPVPTNYKERFSFKSPVASIVLPIPGANVAATQDTIQIHSKLLGESQTLRLRFGY